MRSANASSASGGAGWVLDFIHIENFKSYVNRTSIGPLNQLPFIAIVGPNGSGKSNLMDAISFVMGERTASLRVRSLDELIHGASIGKPVANTASVSAVFKRINDDGGGDDVQNDVAFTRTIRGASSEYMVNRNVVSQQDYFNALKEIGINAKGKNFLVFQGAIESIALKNSKERSALLEEICGSAAIKNEYDQAKTNLAELERTMEKAYLKKRAIFAERKGVKMEVQEAQIYNDILQELSEKETEIALFKLYHIDRELELLANECQQSNTHVMRQINFKRDAEVELEDLKKERGALSRELAGKDAPLQKMIKEKNKKMPKSIEVKQKLKHLEKKLANAQKSLKQAEDNKRNHDEDLEHLREKLAKANEEMQLFLQRHNGGQLVENVDVTLRESQLKEYLKLKQVVLKKTLNEKEKVDDLSKHKRDRDHVFGSVNREKLEMDGKLEDLEREMKEEKELAIKVAENIKDLEKTLKTKEYEASTLREQIQEAENKIETLNQKLEDLSAEIDSEKSNMHEIKKQKQKQEVLKALKDHFTGVFGRVIQLCEPVHARYKVAMAKIIGRNMDAIVVDSARTAKQCIQYLQEQMIEPETFLPLDLLQVKPLKTRLRNLKNQNINLAFDLLQFDKAVERAILHCTKSTVVCPSMEIAKKVASGEFFEDSTNAVSLDGTMYNTNGTLSGGTLDLKRKAQKWSDSQINKKEDQKAKIIEELRKNMITKRNEINLQSLEVEIHGLKKRLDYSKVELNNHIKRAEKSESECKNLYSERTNLENRWIKAEAAVLEVADQLKIHTDKINSTEDQVFVNFCREIGIPNIRAYEEGDVRAHEEFCREKEELESKIQGIEIQIEDELQQEQKLDGNIKRWENIVSEISTSLEDQKAEEETIQKEMAKSESKINNFQKDMESMKRIVESKTKEITSANQKLVSREKILLQAQQAKSRLENSLLQMKLQRHDIYKHCKLSEIAIPFITGSIDDIRIGSDRDAATLSDGGSIELVVNQEDGLEVNFQGLSREMRGLTSDNRKETEKKLEKELTDLEIKISGFQAPNMKADQKWENINAKAREQNAEFEEIHAKMQESRKAFEDIKKRRYDKFMDCFGDLSRNIDGIYKGLTQNASAQAILGLDNMEEPYLDGVTYHCVAPGKPFQSMSNLSGGEKTLAALALLFAIHSCEPAPFFVLDEIDAALDNTNISKVTSYIRQKSKNLQVLVISLKEEFFQDSDALIGIAPDIQPSECIQSKVYILDLTKYT